MTKEELALVIIERLKKEYPGCRLYLRLQPGMEAVSQRPPGSPVYRCQSECGSGRSV